MVRAGQSGYFMASVEIKDCNIMIDGRNIFDQPVQNNIRTYINILEITVGQGDDYATSCLLFFVFSVSINIVR